MFKKNELNAQDLEKVSGGSGLGYASDKYLPADHGVHISAHEGQYHKNEEVYAVLDDDEGVYCWGTLRDSYYSNDKGQIVHKIFVKDHYHGYNGQIIRIEFGIGEENIFKSKEWTLYKKNSL